MFSGVVESCHGPGWVYNADATLGGIAKAQTEAWRCVLEEAMACNARGLMQFVSVCVFVCIMLNNVPHFIKEICIVFDSTHYYRSGNLEGTPISVPLWHRVFIFILAVLR
jgi:hypothetical protein